MAQPPPLHRATCLGLFVASVISASICADERVSISEARPDSDGFLVHVVQSAYQDKATQIRVLQPDRLDNEKKVPVVYVLPVEAEMESRYGDGMKEIKKLGLHNQLGVMFVGPTFSRLPWYADHPTDRLLRQETYLLKAVIPFIDKSYPVRADAEGRLLLGFSKSGYGAWSLLLRHPKVFGKATAWDAPLMLDSPGKYGSGPIFGTEDNFNDYRVSKLLVERADQLRHEKRLALLGYGNFRAEHLQTHAMLEQLKIAHDFRDGPPRKHDWHSGWVIEAVELLCDLER